MNIYFFYIKFLLSIMKDQILFQLWVAKFCIRVAFPRINPNTFLIFLAIKCRLLFMKVSNKGFMDSFEVKPLPATVLNSLLQDENESKHFNFLNHKCLVIPKRQFVELCIQNLFFKDNDVLWLAVRVAPNIKLKYGEQMKLKQEISLLKHNFSFITSEIHKKLWIEENEQNIDNIRIIPVVGGSFVPDNVVYTSETEFYNTAMSYGVKENDVQITLHTIPSYENAPKIAVSAEVSLIVNEFDLSSDFLKEILNNFFETPKIISLNDVFTVNLTPEVTSKYHYKYLDLIESAEKLHFKCIKLINETENSKDKIADKSESKIHIIPTSYIVRGVTQLTIGENIHILKPKEQYFKYENCSLSGLLHLCPSGLKQTFTQIQESVEPFLNGEIKELSTNLNKPIIPMLLLTGSMGSGRHTLVKTLAKYNGLNCLQFDCNALQSSTAKQTESKINLTIQKTKAAAPVIVLLDNFEVFAVDPENNEDSRIMEYFMKTITDLYQNYTKHPIIFIAVTERLELKPNMLRIFLEKFHIPKPNLQQRYEMLAWFTNVMQLKLNNNETKESDTMNENSVIEKSSKDALQRIAAKTQTFLYGDIDTLVHFALRESYLKQLNNDAAPSLHVLNEDNFNTALESIRSLQSQHLDAPKIPKVYWEDIGGLDKLKKELLKTIEFPIKYPHLFKNSSLKRSGILLYGPPGCGKTLVAKAVSTELNVSFLSVKGPELLNMYIGQSEENVRRVFETARASSPCIVFLDELDAAAARRGAAGDSGGAADRVVAQLLAELDSVTAGPDGDNSSFVFVMGATNRPDLLEQSLLRPGRLDKLIYVGPYCGLGEKTSVLTALCRSSNIKEEVSLRDVAAALPERTTGADLLQVASTARAAAVRRVVGRLRGGAVKESELSLDSVVLGVSDFREGIDAFRPSVTDEELAYYESIQM